MTKYGIPVVPLHHSHPLLPSLPPSFPQVMEPILVADLLRTLMGRYQDKLLC